MLKKKGKKLGTLLTVALLVVMGIGVAKPVVANAAEYDEQGNVISLDTPYIKDDYDGWPMFEGVEPRDCGSVKDSADRVQCYYDEQSTDLELCVIDLKGKVLKTIKYSKSNPKHKYVMLSDMFDSYQSNETNWINLPRNQIYGYKVRTSCVSNGKKIYSDWFDLTVTYPDGTKVSNYVLPAKSITNFQFKKNNKSYVISWKPNKKIKGLDKLKYYVNVRDYTGNKTKYYSLGTVKGTKNKLVWKSTKNKKLYNKFSKRIKKSWPKMEIDCEIYITINGEKYLIGGMYQAKYKK